MSRFGLADIPPLTGETPEARQVRLASEVQRKQSLGLGTGIADAINTQWISSWAYRQAEIPGDIIPDPAYPQRLREDGDLWKTLTDGIPPDMWSKYDDTVSLDHALKIRDQLRDVAQSRRNLGEMGWTGTALTFAAGILDPAVVGSAILTGGLAEPLMVGGATATRLGTMARAGIVNALAITPAEVYRATQDPEFHARDVIGAQLGAMVLGGTLGAFGRNAVGRSMRDMELKAAVDAAGPRMAMGAAGADEFRLHQSKDVRDILAKVTDSKEGKVYFKDQLSEASQRAVVEDLIQAAHLSEVDHAADIAAIRGATPEISLRRFLPPEGPDAEIAALNLPPRRTDIPPLTEAEVAARVEQVKADFPNMTEASAREQALREIAAEDAAGGGGRGSTPGRTAPEAAPEEPKRPPPQAGDWNADAINPDRAAFAPIRFSMVGRLGDSDSGLVRMVSSGLFNDALRKGGRRAITSAETWVQARARGVLSGFFRDAEPAVKETVAAYRGRLPEGVDPRLAVMEDATRTLRQAPGMKEAGVPITNKISLAAAKVFDDLHALARRHGVKGFENFDSYTGYVPREYLREAMHRATTQFGDEGVVDIFAGALKHGTPGLEDDAAKAMAKSMVRAINDPGKFGAFGVSRMFDSSEREILAELLAEQVKAGNLAQTEADSILNTTRPQASVKDVNSARARRRASIDEHYVHQFGDGTTFPIQGLLNNNLEELVSKYTREIVGRSAESELLRAVSAKTGQKLESWGGLRAALVDSMEKAGVSRDGMNGIRDTMAKLDMGYRAIRGMPLREGESSFFNGAMANLRAYNELTVGGQITFAHLPDMGRALASGGFDTMLSQIPELGMVIKQAAGGAIPDQVGRELESMLGTGVNDIIPGSTRATDALYGETTGNQQVAGWLDKANKIQRRFSGLEALANTTQIMASRVGLAKWAEFAKSGKLPNAERLAAMGVTRGQAERIVAEIATHAEYADGVMGKSVSALHLERWNGATAADFTQAMQGWVVRSVITNDMGSMAAWMTRPTARILLQFRMFGLRSYERTMLSGVQNYADPATWAKFVTSSFIATLAYTVRQYANSLGRPDAEEFRAERLNPSTIGLSAMGHSGYLSLFPAVSDSITGQLLDKQFFAHGRTTDLNGGALLGNPTVDKAAGLMNAGLKLGRQATNPLTDKEKDLTPGDARQFFNLLPFRNFTGVKNIMDTLSEHVGQ